MTRPYSVFPTPHGFLVLTHGAVTAGPFQTKGEAAAWIDGRGGIEGRPLGLAGAVFAGLALCALAIGAAGLAYALGANLPAIGGGLILCGFAAFLMGR